MDDLLAGDFKQSASANNMYNISNFNGKFGLDFYFISTEGSVKVVIDLKY